MEFTARTAVHPNGRIDEKTAKAQLQQHPAFKPGTVIVGMEKKAGKWVASLHEPKVASPPPFGADGPPTPDSDSPTPSEPKKEETPPKSESDSDSDKSDKKDDSDGAEKNTTKKQSNSI